MSTRRRCFISILGIHSSCFNVLIFSTRYETTHSASPSQSTKADKQPRGTTVPKPKPTYPTTGKIDLPSWPTDSPNDQDVSRVPRRPPPGPPRGPSSSHRVSSPPTNSLRDNPLFNQNRPDSYAGVLDKRPQASYAADNRSYNNTSNPVLPSTNQPIRPSDIKANQRAALKPPKPMEPSNRPARAAPPPPSRLNPKV